jgi:hypothetical protein
VPFRFRSEFGDEEGDADRPDYRHQDHERSPRAGRGEDVRVVTDCKFTEEQEIVNQTDQVPENDGAEAGDDANHKGEERKVRQTDAAALLRVTRNVGSWGSRRHRRLGGRRLRSTRAGNNRGRLGCRVGAVFWH